MLQPVLLKISCENTNLQKPKLTALLRSKRNLWCLLSVNLRHWVIHCCVPTNSTITSTNCFLKPFLHGQEANSQVNVVKQTCKPTHNSVQFNDEFQSCWP